VPGKLSHVSIKMGAGHNLHTVEEFLALPLDQRIQLLLQQRVEFLDDHGRPIPVREAMAQIMKAAQG